MTQQIQNKTRMENVEEQYLDITIVLVSFTFICFFENSFNPGVRCNDPSI